MAVMGGLGTRIFPDENLVTYWSLLRSTASLLAIEGG
jgi:hypothetical protein